VILGTLHKGTRRLVLHHDGTWDVVPADPVLKRTLEQFFQGQEGPQDGVQGHRTLQEVNEYLGGGWEVVLPRRRPGPKDVAY